MCNTQHVIGNLQQVSPARLQNVGAAAGDSLTRSETLMASAQMARIGQPAAAGVEAALRLFRQESLGTIVGGSLAMHGVRSLIRQVAPTNAAVLLTGASGTGKELVARAIHALSPHRDGPFVAINCAALPPSLIESELFGCERGAYTGAAERRAGCFELANNGTLFLDEIGEMTYTAQAKLLRVLEDHNIRRLGGNTEIAIAVRVIAATNSDLQDSIKRCRFRADLYYRLNAFDINLPSLENRKDDIPALVKALIAGLNVKHGRVASGPNSGMHLDALSLLCRRNWPGNVRELKNVIERAVILAGDGVITIDHLGWGLATNSQGQVLPDEGPFVRVAFGTTVDEIEKALIILTVSNIPSKAVAAKALGISYRTLGIKLAQYDSLGGVMRDLSTKVLRATSAGAMRLS
jgi:transcriptional regulator with PAS, ATPase and Fis domain